MTKEELLALIASARTSSSSAWAAAVVVEQNTGPLHVLTNDKATCDVLYGTAEDYINRQTPSTTTTRVQLEGSKFLETQRGLTIYAQGAITALNTYEAAPYYGGSTGRAWASAVNISTP